MTDASRCRPGKQGTTKAQLARLPTCGANRTWIGTLCTLPAQDIQRQ